MKKIALALAATGALVATGANALVIDDFLSSDYQHITATAINGNNSAETGPSAGGIIGPGGTTTGYRYINIATTGTTSGRTSVLDAGLDPGTGKTALVVDNPTFGNSVVTVIWDGTGGTIGAVQTTGLFVSGAGVDFTADGLGNTGMATGFLMDVPAIDTSVSVTFTAWSGTGGSAAIASVTKGFTGPMSDFFVPFADFASSLGTINFKNVGAFQMVLSGGTSWDGAVSFIRTEPTPAPIPGTVMLMGLGLAGLARRFKRA
jgi:hypothetical protein